MFYWTFLFILSQFWTKSCNSQYVPVTLPLLHRYDSGVIGGRSLPLNCDSQPVDMKRCSVFIALLLFGRQINKGNGGGGAEVSEQQRLRGAARREIMQINSSTLFIGQSSRTESDARRGERSKHHGGKRLGRLDANHRRG